MTEFIHKVTKEDEGMEVREIMRTYFDFSARLRNKIKREKLVMLNDEQTPGWIKPEVGDVIRTEPVAGTELKEQASFTIVVSTGPAPRVLPELTGQTVEQATAAPGEKRTRRPGKKAAPVAKAAGRGRWRKA